MWSARLAWAAPIVVAVLASRTAWARDYVLVPSQSTVRVHVGKTGLFGTFGHEHDIAAPAFSGHATFSPEAPAQCQVSATFESGMLRVMPGREPPGDVTKVQETMLGPQVLDTGRYPQIRFSSRTCFARDIGHGVLDVQIEGDLELHGVTRPLKIPFRVQMNEGGFIARGQTTIRQTDFGMKPVTAGGGTVKVKNELTIQMTFTARAAE